MSFMSFVNFSQFNLRYVELHNYLIFYLQCHVYFNTFCYAVDSLSIILQGDESTDRFPPGRGTARILMPE